jgi:hypothetical protein
VTAFLGTAAATKNDPTPTRCEITNSQRNAIKSLQAQIEAHMEKLANYISNPRAYDNRGLLKNAPTYGVNLRLAPLNP